MTEMTIRRKKKGAIGQDEARLPFALLLLYITFEYTRIHTLVNPLSVLKIPLILSVFIAFLWVSKADKTVLSDQAVRLQALFIGLLFATVPFATNNYYAFHTAFAMLLYFVAVTLPLAAFSSAPDRLVRFVRVWLLLHLFIALYGITHEGRGPGSFLTDENDLALALNMAIPYAYFLGKSPRSGRTQRLAFSLTAVLLAAAVIATGSRGGFVGLVAVALAMAFLSQYRIRNLILLGIVGAVLMFSASDHYVEEMGTIADPSDNTRGDRIYSWQRAWEMFLDNPVVGVGTANYPWRVPEYELAVAEPGEPIRLHGGRAAHSLYFTLLPELGLAGTLLFILFASALWGHLRAIHKLSGGSADEQMNEFNLLKKAVTASLVAYFVCGAFLSVLYYPHLWYAAGLILALGKAVKVRAKQLEDNISQRDVKATRGGRLRYGTAVR